MSAKLSFAKDVYDLVIANDCLWTMEDPPVSIAEFARVCRPGGRVVVTMPLRGSFRELYDIYREVLTKHDYLDMLQKLDDDERSFPTAEEATGWFEQAGLGELGVEVDEFELLFRSARELFFAPVIEFGPLPQWKEVAAR